MGEHNHQTLDYTGIEIQEKKRAAVCKAGDDGLCLVWDEMDMGLSRASTRCVTRPAKKLEKGNWGPDFESESWGGIL